jgi:hypothetical protein
MPICICMLKLSIFTFHQHTEHIRIAVCTRTAYQFSWKSTEPEVLKDELT